jgi:ubiquinone/menaquinone biosynthesis C-methylase UbiE
MDTDKIKTYYSSEIEKNRLDLNHFKLEGIRTREIISRYLGDKPLKIADIGGGAGFYAFWLKSMGHHVSMIDLSQTNVNLANEYATTSKVTLDFCEVGDATKLPFGDNVFDIALMLGPLYHLTEKRDRIQALGEARRVLKPGGTLVAAVISRYASLFDGLKRDLINDDRFEKILLNDLHNGIHINDTDNMEYFTTSFFHTPLQISEEIIDSGLELDKLVAVESAGWLIDNLSEKVKKDKRYLEKIQKFINVVESNADLMAMSPHILGIAKKAGRE